MNYQNNLILQAARGEKTTRTPVWMMRQAGRVLPEYRAVRSKLKDFKELLKTPEYAAEVTIQPVDILGVDAAIIFSDILVIPEAMGLPYDMIESRGPHFPKIIENEQDIANLRVTDGTEGLEYVHDAIRLTVRELNGRVPLIGFAGAPWTIFSYMTEGGGSKTFAKAKKWLYNNPEASHRLLDKITQSTIHYLRAQVNAGAALLQVFDSWAGVLSPEQYETFCIPYLARICDSFPDVPVTIFAKDAWFARKILANTSYNVIGMDWCMDISETRAIVGPHKTLQGNLDPCALYAPYNELKKQIDKMLLAYGPDHYIANLGHGLYPDIEKDKVRFFVDTIKAFDWNVK